MRIAFFGNNRLSVRVMEFLKSQGEEIVVLVVHPKARQKCSGELIQLAMLKSDHVWEATRLRDPDISSELGALGAQIGISVGFGFILRPEVFNSFPLGCINLHTSFLPMNRGANPNVWSIVDRTPAGATIHYIDEGTDTGDIIAQQEVPVLPTDTGATLQSRLENGALALWERSWHFIKNGLCPRTPQASWAGPTHRVADLAAIDEIDLDRLYLARDLIDLVRARTFPPYNGAYFMANGRKIFLELKLTAEQDGEEGVQ